MKYECESLDEFLRMPIKERRKIMEQVAREAIEKQRSLIKNKVEK